MIYNLKSAKQESVKVSEDKLSISVDYTIFAEAVDGEIIIPINDGCTVTVAIPAGLANEAENKVMQWFNNKYKKI